MHTDTPAAGTSTAHSNRWFTGCAVALLAFFVLIGLGALALAEFEKSLDGHGQLEQDPHPFGPGATARYEDGLEAAVSAPHREPDGTYRFTVTYDNSTEEELLPGGTSSPGPAPLVVREGELYRDHASGYSLEWLNQDEAVSALMPPLGADDTRTVPVHVRPGGEGTPVLVEVTPPSADYRETAYFQLTLD
ncbi:hypothetical protein [Streptomyces glaucus]